MPISGPCSRNDRFPEHGLNASRNAPTGKAARLAVGPGKIQTLEQSRTPLAIHISLLLGFLCLCVVYLAWVWSNEITDLSGDSSVYMLAARYFSPFWPSSPVFAEFARSMAYPPLFPFLIGMLGGSMLAGHLLVAASLLAATVCLYAWLRFEGIGAGASGCACLIFSLMPGTYLQALNIWSENLYLFLSLLAIAVEIRAETEGEDRPSLWWLAVAAAASASMVRAAALPLLAAFVIRLVIVRPRGWRRMSFGCGIPFVLWSAWNRLHQATANDYVSQWTASYAHDPVGTMITQASMEAMLVLRSWIDGWLGQTSSGSLFYLSMAAGVLCLLGWLRRLAGFRFDAIYVFLYGVLLLVWPFPAEARRLSYVLIPVLLAQGLLLLAPNGRDGRPISKALLPLCLGALTIVILPSLILTVHRFNEPLPPELSLARHLEDWYKDDRRQAMETSRSLAMILADLHRAEGLVPQGECIFAIKPSVVSLYSSRSSYVPPPSSTSAEAFERGIDRCKYAYVLAYVSPSFHQAYYPLDRLNGRVLRLSVVEDGEGERRKTFAALVGIQPVAEPPSKSVDAPDGQAADPALHDNRLRQ